MIAAALAYAARGWRVFPLIPRGKLPLIAKDAGGRGCLDATTDAAKIREWWGAYPAANIGLATGHGFFVLDIDPIHQGDLWLESVTLPDTIQQQTGSGGTHFLFAGPPTIPNSGGKIAPGVDIRGAGGYVVAPPSIHPNGRAYTWVDCEGVPTGEPAPAPQWLIDAAGVKKPVSAPIGEKIKKGTQHERLWKYACSLWGGKVAYTEDEVYAAVLILSKRCEEVPPEANVEKIVHSVTRKHPPGLSPDYAAATKTKPSPEPPPPPDPIDPDAISGDWKDLLHMTGKSPKPVLINADIALRYSPEWEGVLAFDEFKQKVKIVKHPPIGGSYPRDWSDTDDTNTAVWMQSNGIYVGRETVSSAVASIASDRQIHAVREYLAGLKWDGDPRVDGWLTRYLGVERSEYSIQVGRMWLISAIARVMQPGCKADYMLVLEGEQGKKKSTVLEILASQPWFCDHTPDIHHKDAQSQVAGSWIMEWAELDTLSRSEITSVKAFITRRVEKFRPSYGRYTVEVPRQCVFAGTTNRQDWQRDETGGRRFWPVWCTEADLPAITADRDQLWAEAADLYASGSKWWPDDDAAHARIGAEQAQRLESDPWQDKIAEFVSTMDQVTVGLILTNCLGLDISRHTTIEKNRVGRVLRSIGWRYTSWRKKDDPKVVVRGFSTT